MRLSLGVVMVVASLATSCASASKTDESVKPAREIVTGGARIRGGGVRMDVQVGRAFSQPSIRNTGVVARPAAVVTP
ncbi:MAG: hypothetical protein H6Q90_5500 [Deltaproteobacteria bacterium]|nr:hypothetical protein [Deltaproteobacteria bacterium]